MNELGENGEKLGSPFNGCEELESSFNGLPNEKELESCFNWFGLNGEELEFPLEGLRPNEEELESCLNRLGPNDEELKSPLKGLGPNGEELESCLNWHGSNGEESESLLK